MNASTMMYKVTKVTQRVDECESDRHYERELIGYYDKAKDAVKAVEQITGEHIHYRRMSDFVDEFEAEYGRKPQGREWIDLSLAQRHNNSTKFTWNRDFSQRRKYEITTMLFYWGS